MTALEVGGVEDHAHVLLSLSATMAISKAIQLLKGGSSKWVNDTFAEHRSFAWQAGYGAFSIGISQVEHTRRYIASQKEHHRRMSYQEEFTTFLKRHGLEYDSRWHDE